MKRIKNLAIIVATTPDGIIGINNDLPWEFGTQKADMKRFKELTTGNIVVMGSKTFESMGSKPLTKRDNFVLTSKTLTGFATFDDGVVFINPLSLELYLFDLCATNPDKTVFIIGGANLIKQTQHLVSKVHLSIIHTGIRILPYELVSSVDILDTDALSSNKIDSRYNVTDTNITSLDISKVIEGLNMVDLPDYHELDTKTGNYCPYSFVDYEYIG